METTFYAAIAKNFKKNCYGANLFKCGTWKEKTGAKNSKRTHIILLLFALRIIVIKYLQYCLRE